MPRGPGPTLFAATSTRQHLVARRLWLNPCIASFLVLLVAPVSASRAADCGPSLAFSPCEDGDACTIGETCAGGSCAALEGDPLCETPAVGVLQTLAGGPGFGPAAALTLLPVGVAVHGTLVFVSDEQSVSPIVRVVDAATGTASVIAGLGRVAYSPQTGSIDVAGGMGDGGPAARSAFVHPSQLAVDGSGNLFIADRGVQTIRRIDASTGIIRRVAGAGIVAVQLGRPDDDGMAAVDAALGDPVDIAVDAGGDIYLIESRAPERGSRVRRVDAGSGVLRTVAGVETVGPVGDGGVATAAWLGKARGIAVDPAGNVYVTTDQGRIRRIDAPSGTIATIAGTGAVGFSGDDGPALAAAIDPADVALDSSGNVVFYDLTGHRLRRIDRTTGLIVSIAGNGEVSVSGDAASGFARQSAVGADAVAVDAVGRVVLADRGDARIRRVDTAADHVDTIAGNGTFAYAFPKLGSVPGIATQLDGSGLTVGPDGAIFLPADDLVLRVEPDTGSVATAFDASGNDLFFGIGAIAFDQSGGLLVATANTVVQVDAATAFSHVIAGYRLTGDPGDGGPATSAFIQPSALAVDRQNNLLIADCENHRVRRVDATSRIITTIAGTGVPGFSGDGGPGTAAEIGCPRALAVDPDGNVLIADVSPRFAGTDHVRRLARDGTISTATGAQFLDDVAVDAAGRVFFATAGDVKMLEPGSGTVSTVVGNGAYAADGAWDDCLSGTVATAAPGVVTDIAVDRSGDLLVAKGGCVQKLKVGGVTTTTTPGGGTTTTTTPGCGFGCASDPCSRATGLDAASCVCDRPLPLVCAGQTLPRSAARVRGLACDRLSGVTAQGTPKAERTILLAVAHLWTKAGKKAGAAAGKSLSRDCAAALRDEFGDARRRATSTAAELTPSGSFKDANAGIAFTARPKGTDRVVLRWRASKAVRQASKQYVFEIWRGRWSAFLFTKQGTDKGIPVVGRLPDGNASFCFRMIGIAGTDEETSPIVGSGTSGNAPPCS